MNIQSLRPKASMYYLLQSQLNSETAMNIIHRVKLDRESDTADLIVASSVAVQTLSEDSASYQIDLLIKIASLEEHIGILKNEMRTLLAATKSDELESHLDRIVYSRHLECARVSSTNIDAASTSEELVSHVSTRRPCIPCSYAKA
jgi:hypothetical protein